MIKSIATLTEEFFAIYKRETISGISSLAGQLVVNKNLKLRVSMVLARTLPNHILFMTIGLCVASARAVCEPLIEGAADYCMIVCE